MMSRDRVHFTLDTYGLDLQTRTAFKRAFGIDPPAGPNTRPGGYCDTTVTVVCRPSQFARFLIYRNDEGGKNAFKNLNPKLVEIENILDVSINPKGG